MCSSGNNQHAADEMRMNHCHASPGNLGLSNFIPCGYKTEVRPWRSEWETSWEGQERGCRSHRRRGDTSSPRGRQGRRRGAFSDDGRELAERVKLKTQEGERRA